MAMALTMVLNCREPVDCDGCGRCPSCRQLIGGNFPDFIHIRPDGQNIKIEQIRGLNRRLSFAPVSARHRVCVVQQAEAMTGEAANSFLKTLEEPPPGNILILNAREPRNLLPTIVSRCQRVPFQPLPFQAMVDWLVSEKNIDGQRARIAAKGSSGSLGGALTMCEELFLKIRDEWLSTLMKLPRFSKGEALEMAFESASRNKRGGIDNFNAEEPGLLEMLAVWGGWYRDLLLVKVGGPARLIINVDFSDKFEKLARNSKKANLIESLFVVNRAIRDLHRMRNAALVMEHAVLKLQRLGVNEF